MDSGSEKNSKSRKIRNWAITLLVLVSLTLISWGSIGSLTTSLIPKSESKVVIPVAKTEWGAEVLLRGNEEGGVNSGVVLKPGEKARISWKEGKITFKKPNGDYKSYPIWGAPSYNPRYRDEFRFSNRPGIPAAGVLVLLGPVESPEKVVAFSEGYTSVLVENTSGRLLPITLYFHDMLWDYDENGGDGSYAVFKVYKFRPNEY